MMDVGLNNYTLTPPIVDAPLPGVGTNNHNQGLHTGAGDYVWRTYHTHADAATILYEHKLLAWLNQQPLSFAVPAPVPMKNGQTLCHTEAGFHALFPWLPGVPPDRKDPSHMVAVGAALGELHTVLHGASTAPRPGLAGYAALAQIHPGLPEPWALTPAGLPPMAPPLAPAEIDALLSHWRAELIAIKQWTASQYAALPVQVIHGDFTPGNMLIVGKRVAAILDFDFAIPDARAVDVAAGLYYVMSVWENPEPWPVAAAFCQGYSRHVQLTHAEIAALPWLMRLRNAVSAIYRLGKHVAANQPLPTWRLRAMLEFTDWLDKYGERFAQLLDENCGPSRPA
ncbi:MAG: phosphotransferase [Caldilineaceae bacterium]|nr:phosphotransferase [Caldilineaceae bacterium]